MPTTSGPSSVRMPRNRLKPDAGDVEDALGDDRAAHQVAQVDAEEGDHRDQRVAQHVHADDPALGQALGRAVRT